MPPPWLTVVSWVSLGVAFLCAALILYDLFGRGYRQHMWIMEAVWPITALHFGPLALWTYFRWGRPQSAKWIEEHGGEAPEKGFAASPCGLRAPRLVPARVQTGRRRTPTIPSIMLPA